MIRKGLQDSNINKRQGVLDDVSVLTDGSADQENQELTLSKVKELDL